MNERRDIHEQGRTTPASTSLGKGLSKMLGSRTALGVSLFLFASCYSEDRPLNDHLPGGAGGSSNAEAGESNAGAGDAAAGDGPVAGQGGSQTAGTAGAAGSTNAGSGGSSAGNGGSGTSSGGTTSGGTTSGGTGGDAGEAGVPVGALCNSSDGEGCDTRQFCIDAVNDDCPPDSEGTCAGFCAEPAPRADLLTTCTEGNCPEGFSCVVDPVEPGRRFCTGTRECDASTPCAVGFVCGAEGVCAPDKVACTGTVLCPAIVAPCAPGYTHSIVDECFGPCVPLESCGCASDFDCVDRAASCDRVAGRCVIPKSPEPRCALPYETGDCLAAMPVFAFVDGSCQPQVYGGCGGNDNRFASLEECRARCEGAPNPQGCPEGTALETICFGCGPADGCVHWQTLCGETCDENTECSSPFLYCSEGFCRGACL
jgi:hypothetical protein